MIFMPCPTIWANTMGIFGGALFGVTQADFTLGTYLKASVESLYLRDIFSGLLKSAMFGVTITAVGCLEGLSAGGGAEQIDALHYQSCRHFDPVGGGRGSDLYGLFSFWATDRSLSLMDQEHPNLNEPKTVISLRNLRVSMERRKFCTAFI